MRYAFIVNPTAGQAKRENGIIKDIKSLIDTHSDKSIAMHYTRCPMDAIRLADALASEADIDGEEIVVYACGGDGTVNEVANGIYGHDNAILGVVPSGSGNDLVRELPGNAADYLNPDKQIGGHEMTIDVLEMSWDDGEKETKRIAVNGINIGFDGNAAVLMNELKSKPLISGHGVYIAAVLKTLIRKDGQDLRITADGELFHDGKLLLTTMANGGYCGGGVRSCPRAELGDGLLELMAINDMTRLSFVSKFPKYKKGKIFEIKDFDRYVKYRQAERVTIEPLRGDSMKFVADGEVIETGRLNVEIKPGAMRVLVI